MEGSHTTDLIEKRYIKFYLTLKFRGVRFLGFARNDKIMLLQKIILQNFRSYTQSLFDFSPHTTVIIGPNTAGKTNLMEAIWLLSSGKSFRVEKDMQMVRFEKDVARVKGMIVGSSNAKRFGMGYKSIPAAGGTEGAEGTKAEDKEVLEVMLASGETTGGRFVKRYTVNDIPKRRADFAGHLPAVLFSPEELDIVSAGPSLRRRFLDDVLEQVDVEYRRATSLYEKALRQRNALLDLAKETGRRKEEEFAYWDSLLIQNGQYITHTRELFLETINDTQKEIFDIRVTYDKSTISEERLLQYKDAEMGAGVTLVGPHRDDFSIYKDARELKYFGSRGQQRLGVLQLKLVQQRYIEKALQVKPLLLLDDIFSELDSQHMELVLSMLRDQQAIVTTTHKEFVKADHLKSATVIAL